MPCYGIAISDFTETYDNGSNVGGWSFGPLGTILPDGGNPS
ncbi:MAG: hypothetical protein ACR2HJ_08625 [Fimbriimonadales bacterium]